MDYIDYRSYFDDFDVSILTRKEYHEYRKKYRFLTLIGRYLNSCILEFNRIDDWAGLQQNLGTRIVSGLEASKFELVFSDFHFLLISMDKCYKYEQQLYLLFNRSDKATELEQAKEGNWIDSKTLLQYLGDGTLKKYYETQQKKFIDAGDIDKEVPVEDYVLFDVMEEAGK